MYICPLWADAAAGRSSAKPKSTRRESLFRVAIRELATVGIIVLLLVLIAKFPQSLRASYLLVSLHRFNRLGLFRSPAHAQLEPHGVAVEPIRHPQFRQPFHFAGEIEIADSICV